MKSWKCLECGATRFSPDDTIMKICGACVNEMVQLDGYKKEDGEDD